MDEANVMKCVDEGALEVRQEEVIKLDKAR